MKTFPFKKIPIKENAVKTVQEEDKVSGSYLTSSADGVFAILLCVFIYFMFNIVYGMHYMRQTQY